jgi:uncharacterized protein (DUF983 family)
MKTAATWYKSGVTMSCPKCSDDAPIEEFFKNQPREHYLCPSCGHHFQRYHCRPYFCVEGPAAGMNKPGPVLVREVKP